MKTGIELVSTILPLPFITGSKCRAANVTIVQNGLVGISVLTIILAFIIVIVTIPTENTNVGLIENHASNSLINARCVTQGMFYHINFRAPPFDNKIEQINEICRSSHINNGCQRRKINYNIVKILA